MGVRPLASREERSSRRRHTRLLRGKVDHDRDSREPDRRRRVQDGSPSRRRFPTKRRDHRLVARRRDGTLREARRLSDCLLVGHQSQRTRRDGRSPACPNETRSPADRRAGLAPTLDPMAGCHGLARRRPAGHCLHKPRRHLGPFLQRPHRRAQPPRSIESFGRIKSAQGRPSTEVARVPDRRRRPFHLDPAFRRLRATRARRTSPNDPPGGPLRQGERPSNQRGRPKGRLRRERRDLSRLVARPKSPLAGADRSLGPSLGARSEPRRERSRNRRRSRHRDRS